MARAHDVGGHTGLGPIEIEADEPVFHDAWEARIFGIMMAGFGKGLFNVEQFRAGIEGIHSIAYLKAQYYERWLSTLEENLIRVGIVTEDDLDRRTVELSHATDTEMPRREEPEFCEMLMSVIEGGFSPEREIEGAHAFDLGDRVFARGTDAPGHTRLPRYVRDKQGVVVRLDKAFVYPETSATGAGEHPEWCYCVRFDAAEIWGQRAERDAPVFVDVWESYLEAA